jgi:hypothetical protein
MKKITLLIAFFLAIVTGSYGQSASTYDFASSVGTYTQTSAAATLLPTVRADTSISTAQNIGFTFVYEGANYTQFKMGSNGFISLNATGTATLGTNNFSTANATSRPIIAPLWDDLDGATPASSVAAYELTGTAPNRVLTVEWRNWEWNWNSATPVISFQAKLYETTNVIEFVYRQEATAVASGSASIGIGSATGSGAGSFLNLTDVITPAVSSLTANTTISVKPITGRIFSFTPASCFKPGGITASAVTQTTATVSWNATVPAPATGYEYVVSTSNVAPAGAGTATTNLSEPVIGLAASTTYYIFVRSNCGAGFSSWNGPVAFTTLCNAVAVPWTENFDALTAGTNVFPSCWAYANTTENWYISTTNPVANSGANSLRRTWSTNGWAFSPMTTLVAGTSYTFSYYVRTNDNVVGYDITIGTGTGQTAGDMTNTLSAVTGYQGPTWTKVTHEFTPTISGDYSFGIHVVAPNAPNGINFDDFKLEETPSCLDPTVLTATNITATSADLSWIENGSATSWNVEWGATPFTQGTGTLASGVTNPYNLTGLLGNTTYQYYVQADCGGSGTSTWAGPYSFKTLCNAFPAPYTEAFENAGTIPSCWSMSGGEIWRFANTGTGNHIGNNGVITGATTSGGYFAWVDDSTPDFSDVTLTSPLIDASTLTSPRLTFFELSNNEGNQNSTLTVEVWDGAAWNNVAVYNTNTVGGWEKKVVSLSALTITGNIQVRFIYSGDTTGFYDDIAIDDVTIEESPLCIEPSLLAATNLTATSSDLSWTENGSATSWNVEWGATPFTQGTGTLASGVTNPYNLTGLSGNTTYQYYVQADCGGSGTSAWVGPYSFTTPCTAIAVPWTENFDALTAGVNVFPSCWAYTNTTSTWSISNTPVANSGANSLRRTYSTNGWAFTPLTTLVAGTSYTFSYYVRTEDTTVGYDITIGTGTGQTVVDMTNTLSTVTGYQGPTWTKVTHEFTPTISGDYSFGVHVVAPLAPNGINFDDFVLEETPSCIAPIATASNITPTSVDITWPATSGNYEYVLDSVVTNPAGAGTVLVVETYNTALLSPLTTYYFHVRTDCGASSFSTWTTISFTTLATPPVNDNCSAPIALTPGGVFADQDIDTTNMGGTLSTETPSPTCGTFGFATKGKDVWYSVVVPASGTLTIETDVTTAGTGLLLDTVTQIYSGTCGALVAVACDDSLGNISSPAGADYSRVSLTAQTPGATLLVRAFGYNGTQGNFSISAYDASLSTRSFDATGFSAYPNPVKDVLNLSYTTPISSVSVHNLLGQEVMTKSINATQSKIDMSNLSNGTYLVKVTVDGLVKTLKVVKQ